MSHYLSDSGARIAIIHVDALACLNIALLQDASCLVVVGTSSTAHAGTDWEARIRESDPALETHPTAANDPAFFLYTTGSTGLPKAAVHRHKSMLVTTRSFAQSVLEMGPDDRTLSIPKLFFAYGLGNGMYFPLGVGASTILNPGVPNLDYIAQLIARHRPTLLFAVPTFLRALFKELDNGLEVDLSSVRLIVFGGEPAPAQVIEKYREQLGVEMPEGLGSTEMLQTFISNRPGGARSGSCGVAVPNYEVQLLGEDEKPVAEGEIGTLWLKGESCFLGYWNQPELTARIKVGDWLRTGDKLYRDAAGYYHFCGRGDSMLKVSGKWFAPQEIESVLSQHPAVEQAVIVTAKSGEESKRLVGYVVSRDGAAVNIAQLRRFLAEKFPEQLIPLAFVQLPELPLTGSGKVDRMSLAAFSLSGQSQNESQGLVESGTPTEKELAEIWSSVLGVENIGTSDDFLDLGGSSMLAIQCLSRIKRAFGVEFSLEEFFEHATISQLAQIIGRMGWNSNRLVTKSRN